VVLNLRQRPRRPVNVVRRPRRFFTLPHVDFYADFA
jgi:hypothetical protein